MVKMEHAKKKPVSAPAIVAIVCAVMAVIIAAVVIFLPGGDDNDAGLTTDTASEISGTTADETVTKPVLTEGSSGTESAEAVHGTNGTNEPPVTEYVPPAVRDTDFSGCLFIGDSRTEGFMLYSGVRGAKAYTARGLMVDTYFTSPVVDMNGKKVTVSEALEADTSFSSVYIMLGINELGWAYDSVFISKYENLLDHVRSCMPDAKIIVQSIIPVTAAKSQSDEIYNNENIARYNGLIREMCAKKGITFADLVPYFTGADGSLPEEAAFDGIHLQKSYCERWLDVLKMS